METDRSARKRKSTARAGRHRQKAISGPIEAEFLQFIDFHQAKRLNKNLRRMLLEFLMHDGAFEALYLKELMYDLNGLFILLDAIEAADQVGEVKTS